MKFKFKSDFKEFNGTFRDYRLYRYELVAFLNKCGLKESDLNHPYLEDVLWLIDLATNHWNKFNKAQRNQLEMLYTMVYQEKKPLYSKHIDKYNRIITRH